MHTKLLAIHLTKKKERKKSMHTEMGSVNAGYGEESSFPPVCPSWWLSSLCHYSEMPLLEFLPSTHVTQGVRCICAFAFFPFKNNLWFVCFYTIHISWLWMRHCSHAITHSV
jgi:hypothetical protein